MTKNEKQAIKDKWKDIENQVFNLILLSEKYNLFLMFDDIENSDIIDKDYMLEFFSRFQLIDPEDEDE